MSKTQSILQWTNRRLKTEDTIHESKDTEIETYINTEKEKKKKT